jgi:hypothetical protein
MPVGDVDGGSWDEEALMKAWTADQAGVVKKANCGAVLRQFISPIADPESTAQCQICFDDVKAASTFAMKCGHRFCLPCWRDFLKNTIDAGTAAGSNCLSTNCPGFKCKEIVGEQVYELLVDDVSFKKYRDTQLLSFVDDNENICWCPVRTPRTLPCRVLASLIYPLLLLLLLRLGRVSACRARAAAMSLRFRSAKRLCTARVGSASASVAKRRRTRRRPAKRRPNGLRAIKGLRIWIRNGCWKRRSRVPSAACARARRAVACIFSARSAKRPGAGTAANLIT